MAPETIALEEVLQLKLIHLQKEIVKKPQPKSFRKDVQGLRGIAIIYVLIFHLSPKLLPHGFLGVDIFFVISGYLITMILSKQSRLSWPLVRSFYSRRVQRIFPAYYLTVVLILWFGHYFLATGDYRLMAADSKWALAFASNIHKYLQNSDYFAEVGNYDFLLHTWSLAVEIQFYCIAPIAVAVCQEGIIGKICCIVAALFSLFYNFTKSGPLGFSSLQCRIWQFFLGGAAFLWTKRQESKADDTVSDDEQPVIKTELFIELRIPKMNVETLFLLLGIITVSPLILFLPLSDAWCRLSVTLGSALIVALKHPDADIIIGNKFLYFVGDISYSLYLAHWPVIIFMKYDNNLTTLGHKDAILAAEYSTLLAIICYNLVEKLFTNKGFYRTLVFIIATSAVSIFLMNSAITTELSLTVPEATPQANSHNRTAVAQLQLVASSAPVLVKNVSDSRIVNSKTRFERFCYDFHKISHIPENFTEDTRRAALSENEKMKRNPPNTPVGSEFDPMLDKHFYKTGAQLHLGGYYKRNGSTSAVIFGNSYAHRAFHPIVGAFGNRFREIRLVSTTGCVPFLGSTFPTEEKPGTCKKWFEHSLELIEEMKPDVVFFIFRPFPPFDSQIVNITTDKVMADMQYTIDRVAKVAKRIIIEMPLPLDPDKFQTLIVNKALQRRESFENIKLDYDFVWGKHQYMIRRLEYLHCSKCNWIYPHKIFCDSKVCRVFDPDNMYSFFDDQTHYNAHAFKCIGQLYKDTLDEMYTRKYI